MYQKIMVPLDGSKLAECVLPYVEELAKGCSTEEVILVSVTERIVGYRPSPQPQRVDSLGQLMTGGETSLTPEPVGRLPVAVGKMARQAHRYLGRVMKRLEAKGIKTRCEVLLGNPADEIASFAEHDSVDLIIMASHGRSGPSRWAYGSVADKVFRASCVPILMVRAPGCMVGV